MGLKLNIIDVSVFLYPPSRPSVSRSTMFWRNSFKVFITDSVLSSIGAFELIKFQNRREQLEFPKQQKTALNILRDYMICKNTAVIDYDDFFIGDAIFNNEPDLVMFQYKNTNDKFMSHDECHNIKMQGFKGV